MQLFIASTNTELIRYIESCAETYFSDSVNLGAFPLDQGASCSVALAMALEASSLVVMECCEGLPVSPHVGWMLGACFVMGTPILGVSRPGETPEKWFSPWQDVVTIVQSMDDLQATMNVLGAAISEGMESYAEVATELHTKFLGE